MARRRVVVTGLGVVSPVGIGVAETWQNIVAGKSGIGRMTRFDPSAFACQVAGEVNGFDVTQYIPAKDARRMDRFVHFGLAAGIEAFKDSGLVVTEQNAERIGVCISSGIGGLPMIEETHNDYLAGGPRKISPFFIPGTEELLYDKFEEIIFSGNRLSYPVIGKENNIRNFGADDLFNYHGSNYNTDGLLVVASGNVKHDELIKLTEKYITERESKRRRSREKFNHRKVEDAFIEKDVQQVHTIIGRATYGYNDKRRVPVRFLSALIVEGSSSRLFLAIREKLGITYQINSFLNSYNDTSSFGIYFSTNLNQYAKGYRDYIKEFKRLKDFPVSEKELKKVKEYLKLGIIGKINRFKSEMYSCTITRSDDTTGWRSSRESGGAAIRAAATRRSSASSALPAARCQQHVKGAAH